MGGLEQTLARGLARWVRFVQQRATATVAVCALVTLALGALALTQLGVDTDNRRSILAEDLPSEKRARRFEKIFPGLTNALLVVVEAKSPALAREAARELAGRLAGLPEIVRGVEAPALDPFFEEHALLYLEPEALEDFGDQLLVLQPLLAELERSPNLATLTRVLRTALDSDVGSPAVERELPGLLDRFGESVLTVQAGHPLRVSWADLLLDGWSFSASARQTLVVEPVLETEAVLPAARPIEAIRNAAADLGPDVRVRITGYPALNHEEMIGLLWDVGVAGLFTFVVALLLLVLALRSFRLVAAAGLTLVAGLVWTAAFAGVAVGRLNLVSLTFAVLFIGLGVDFAIHLGMHYGARRRAGLPNQAAMADAVQTVGPSLALCTVSTAIGFFAFLPTDYRGVAELGLIAGVGMFVIFGLTLTLFPALLSSGLRVRALRMSEPRLPFEPRHGPSRPGLVGALAGVAAALALLVGSGVRFDSDVVAMRDPDTESVRTWNDLLASGSASPWFADVLAPDLGAARAQAAVLEALPQVDRALTLEVFVPEEQELKQEILADLAFLLAAPPALAGRAPDEDTRVDSVQSLRDALLRARADSAPAALSNSAERLAGRLASFLREGGDLGELETALLGDLPGQLVRLRRALEPSEVELADLPSALSERMLAPDGSARVQVFPAADLSDATALASFVSAVQGVAPEATGLPVNAIEAGRATAASLREALTLALVSIALLLLALWRRPGDVALAMTPLLLAAAWTVGVMAWIDMPFNFANVIVLPLLLGTGIDSGIHLVTRAARPLGGGSLAGTTTGRAVFFSAATTLLSFGSLAFSGHRGIASLGLLLVLGMSLGLVANLFVLPSLVALRARRRAAAARAQHLPS